ncbi:MAG: hypothetical protein LUF34_12535 [Lachnospiraceae bacterium]|nr:hypothetical protein [Lachnospiraceae bacterium]
MTQKTIHRLTALALAALLLFSQAGCASSDSETSAADETAASHISDSSILANALTVLTEDGASGTFELTYRLSQEDGDDTTEISMEFSGSWSGSPGSTTDYMEGTATATQFGNADVLEMETWLVQEETGARCYTNVSDYWSYLDLETGEAGSLGNLSSLAALTEEELTATDSDGDNVTETFETDGTVLDTSLALVRALLKNAAICDTDTFSSLTAEIQCTLDEADSALESVTVTFTDPDGAFYDTLGYNGVEGSLEEFIVTLTLTGDGTETPSLPEEASEATEEIAAEDIDDSAEEYEEETMEALISDGTGRYQVWDNGDAVSAWVSLPDGYTADEENSYRNGLYLYSDTEDPDIDASYYLYNADEGYLDMNMTDPFDTETDYFDTEEAYQYDGPSDTETVTIEEHTVLGASLYVTYTEDDTSLYILEYILWEHLDDNTIVTCTVHISSDNEESVSLTLEEAAELFFSGISLE